jgi:hypothetical protein
VTGTKREDAFTSFEVVTYALAQLGGIDGSVHLETIAIKAHELAPGAFRWDREEYARFIDKDLVRVALTDAEKPEKGALVQAVGITKRGKKIKRTDYWRLTSAGATWVLSNEERIKRILGGPTPGLARRKADEARKRLTSSPLYKEFQQTGHVTPDLYALTDLLECSPDAADSIVAQRFDSLRAQAQLLDEPELLTFLEVCARAHSDIL